MSPSKKYNKRCFVPCCGNTSINFPDKIFVSVPKYGMRKISWLHAVGRPTIPISKTAFYCCDDHFNFKEDMVNYIQYKLIGGRVYLKKDVIPHVFKCPDCITYLCPFQHSNNLLIPTMNEPDNKCQVNSKLQDIEKIDIKEEKMEEDGYSNLSGMCMNGEMNFVKQEIPGDMLIKLENNNVNNEANEETKQYIVFDPLTSDVTVPIAHKDQVIVPEDTLAFTSIKDNTNGINADKVTAREDVLSHIRNEANPRSQLYNHIKVVSRNKKFSIINFENNSATKEHDYSINQQRCKNGNKIEEQLEEKIQLVKEYMKKISKEKSETKQNIENVQMYLLENYLEKVCKENEHFKKKLERCDKYFENLIYKNKFLQHQITLINARETELKKRIKESNKAAAENCALRRKIHYYRQNERRLKEQINALNRRRR